jgi:carboxypeptidase T
MLCVLANIFLMAQSKIIYSRVKIDLKGKTMSTLAATGASVDHGDYKKDEYFIAELSSNELKLIQNAGFTYTVLVADVTKNYQENRTLKSKKKVRSGNCFAEKIYNTPNDFQLGTMGDFYTYEEIMAHMDSLTSKYPNLVSVKQVIDTFKTFENRPIYWLKISDNPNVDENETEIFHNALHHAREPMSVMQMIYYMYYLCENYTSDSEIKYFVDHSEQYFIPVVNPDGYIYNQTTNPSGGGMWRKNRRDNLDGTFGVDINRNYGYYWGINNTGSSPMTSSDTYRGVAAFSEPETKAIKYFCEQHHFVAALNNHSFSNLLIYPWGYNDSNSNDSVAFTVNAKLQTDYNRYRYGRDMETVGYSTNGTSDDWMYGEQTTKNKILATTPEIGDPAYGFWPPTSDLLNQCNDNLHLNINFMRTVLAYTTLDPINSDYITSSYHFAKYVMNNIGYDSNLAFTVKLIPITSNITAIAPIIYTNLNRYENLIDSIPFTLASNIQHNDIIKYALSIDNGFVTQYDTIVAKYTLHIDTLFNSRCDNLTGWNNIGNWGNSSLQYVSASNSITESPNGNSANNYNGTITTSLPINLMDKNSAKLLFNAQWTTECEYDYMQVQISANNGVSFENLCTRKSMRSKNQSIIDEASLEGMLYEWAYDEASLNDYLNKNILLRFKIITDGGFTKDGFYLDDVFILATPNSVEPTLTNNINFENQFHIYPNPVEENLYIQNTKNQNFGWRITSAVGAEILKNNNSNTLAVINTSTLANGIYFIEINTNNQQQFVQRFVKK